MPWRYEEATYQLLLVLNVALGAAGKVGDQKILRPQQIEEFCQEPVKDSDGRIKRVNVFVIYKDDEGRRRIASITKTELKKLQRCQQYGLYFEYILTEGKTKNKITIKE